MTPGLTYYPVTKSLMNAVDHQLLLTALLGTFASLSLSLNPTLSSGVVCVALLTPTHEN